MILRYPKILNKSFKSLQVLTNKLIVSTAKEAVENEMTKDMLIGNIANRLLATDSLQSINNSSYHFKKALLIRVQLVVNAMKFDYVENRVAQTSKDGAMFIAISKTIINQRDAKVLTKEWFKEVDVFKDTITIKGSNKVLDNNSTEVLKLKASKTYKVKEIDPKYIDLYVTLLYEATKHKVAESTTVYQNRLKEIAEETKFYMGYEYSNYRKLDSNTRNYPLQRFGFSVEYGDAFEKFLVEPARSYIVEPIEVEIAKRYLEKEFNSDDCSKLAFESLQAVAKNKELLEEYEKGYTVEFTITHKEFGKHLHIIDVYKNIICNVGNETTTMISVDFTNSGGIMAANQFGDTTFLKAMNLLGGKDISDTHQEIATFLEIDRDDAKKVMQGPNHGGSVREDLVDMVDSVFGENYKYIRLIAEYGTILAKKGHTNIELVRPDGVKAYWSPYTVDSKVSMEDGTVVSAIMPYGGSGESKELGLAVACLHSSDSFVEHHIEKGLMALGYQGKSTLDNFYNRPKAMSVITDLAFEAFELLRGHTEVQLALIEAATGVRRGWRLPSRPEIVKSSNIF